MSEREKTRKGKRCRSPFSERRTCEAFKDSKRPQMKNQVRLFLFVFCHSDITQDELSRANELTVNDEVVSGEDGTERQIK